MPIKGLTEQRRMPRLGKIRTGVKVPNKSGSGEHPEAVDYFKLPDEIAEQFGEKPRSLPIMFPVEDEAKFASQYYKCYSSYRGLVCKGDGETCWRLVDVNTGDFAHRESKETTRRELSCTGRDCPMYQQKKCKEVMNLQFLIPSVPGLGVWQLDTGSYHSIVAINSAIDLIRSVCGRIAMIPLKLTIEPKEVSPDGTKKTVNILQIRNDITLSEIQKLGALPGSQVLIPPPDEEEVPEELYPEVKADKTKITDKEIDELWDKKPAPKQDSKPQDVKPAVKVEQAEQSDNTDFLTYVKEAVTIKLKWKVSTLASWLNAHRMEIGIAQEIKGATIADLLNGFNSTQQKKTCDMLNELLKARG
jgi:hypothetical protein